VNKFEKQPSRMKTPVGKYGTSFGKGQQTVNSQVIKVTRLMWWKNQYILRKTGIIITTLSTRYGH